MKTRGKALRKIKNPDRAYFNRPYYSDIRALQGTENKALLESERITKARGRKHKKSF
jgi:hypothetical protein